MWRELFVAEVLGHLLDTVVILVAVDCGSINLECVSFVILYWMLELGLTLAMYLVCCG